MAPRFFREILTMTLNWKGDDENGYIGQAGDQFYSVTRFLTGMGHFVYWTRFLDVARVKEDPELLELHGALIWHGLPIRTVEEAKARCEADHVERGAAFTSPSPTKHSSLDEAIAIVKAAGYRVSKPRALKRKDR
jgi:hypothetical protein